ncbi:MAG: autotransporter domain-containing protein [Xanthobacteraceae bacterium]
MTGTGSLGALGSSNTVTGGQGGKGGDGVSDVSGGDGGSGGIGLSLTASAPTVTIDAAVTGGLGGAGGTAGGGFGSNGDGGAGGIGIVGNAPTLTITSTVSGGDGGAGGNSAEFEGQGTGGGGGAGVTLTGGTIANQASIFGGNGGTGGSGGTGGGPGAGGAGVTGSNITIVNSGSISGGLGNAGAQANAITFTGGTNTLQLQAGSTITGNVVAFSTADTLALGGSTNSTFTVSNIGPSSQYRGFGIYVKTGSSVWTLSGTTTAVTPWTINQGTLSISSDSNLGASSGGLTFGGGTLQFLAGVTTNRTVTLNAGGGTFDTDGNDATLTGAIGGAGALTKIDSGILYLTSNDNTYLGGTNINGGTLSVGADSALGTGTVAIANGGNLQNDAANLTIANAITLAAGNEVIDTNIGNMTLTGQLSGAGAFYKTSGGVLTLTNSTNNFSGGINLNGGTMAAGASNAFGTGPVAMASGTTVQAAAAAVTLGNAVTLAAGTETINTNGNDLMISGQLSGTGTLDKIDAGTLTLSSGSAGYSGTIDLNAGTITAGASNALGTGTLAMAAGTTLSFLNTGNFTIANPITIAGDPTFSPPSGTTQTLSGVIADGATPGTLNENGAGTLVLSATNTYTGPTNVAAGTLTVNGSIALSSLTTVSSGATLNGIGTVGNMQVNSGGTFAPGSGTAGTSVTVAGGLTLATGSTYQVFVNPATASSATVSGTANLGGATANATFANGSYISKVYTILTGGSVSGTFGSLTNTNRPANFTDTLSYDATHAYLNLTLNFTSPSYAPLNVNQINVANTLVNYFNTTGGIPTVFGTLSSTQLSQVDGEDAADAQNGAFQLMSDFLNLMLDPSSGGGISGGGGGVSGGALGFAPEQDATLPSEVVLAYNAMLTKAPPKPQSFEQRWTAWGSAFGGTSRTDGDPVVGSNTVNAGDYGYAGGADYRVSRDTVLGFALAGGGTNWNLAQGLGSGRSDALQAGIYAKTHSGPAYLSAALAFANNWFTTNRTSALGDQLQAKFQGQSYGGRIEAGYRYGLPAANGLAGLTPYAAVQAQVFHTPSYTETDLTGGGFGLAFNAMSGTDTRSELGARADDLTMLGAMRLILRARLAWAHDWISNPALTAAFQVLPGSSFVVNGAAPPKDSALTTLGAELRMTENWSLLGKFDGQFGNGAQTYGGAGTLRYTW